MVDLIRESMAGKVAVILGVGPGQGITATKLFINFGAKVALISRSGNTFGLAESSTIKAYKADATNEDELVAARDKILSDYGQIDFLYNNVGKWLDPGKSPAFPDKGEMADMFESNVLTLESATKIFSDAMKKSGGSIVNVGAAESLFRGNTMSYTVAKSAVTELTRKSAEALRKYNIRVNCVHPGSVHAEGDYRHIFPFNFQKLADGTELHPIEVGYVGVFLASEMAYAINGQSITVDRGSKTVD
ncbi:hypothetical protein IX51_10180 [uncultured archaeon]|nr:hypothetical protein IX51_10180 [uncultured archaeon]